MVDIETFSGGAYGLPNGACGLLAAVGEFSLDALLKKRNVPSIPW